MSSCWQTGGTQTWSSTKKCTNSRRTSTTTEDDEGAGRELANKEVLSSLVRSLEEKL